MPNALLLFLIYWPITIIADSWVKSLDRRPLQLNCLLLELLLVVSIETQISPLLPLASAINHQIDEQYFCPSLTDCLSELSVLPFWHSTSAITLFIFSTFPIYICWPKILIITSIFSFQVTSAVTAISQHASAPGTCASQPVLRRPASSSTPTLWMPVVRAVTSPAMAALKCCPLSRGRLVSTRHSTPLLHRMPVMEHITAPTTIDMFIMDTGQGTSRKAPHAVSTTCATTWKRTLEMKSTWSLEMSKRWCKLPTSGILFELLQRVTTLTHWESILKIPIKVQLKTKNFLYKQN